MPEGRDALRADARGSAASVRVTREPEAERGGGAGSSFATEGLRPHRARHTASPHVRIDRPHVEVETPGDV